MKLSNKHIDICSGIGGFALAARWMGWKTVQFIEIEKWCQEELKVNFPGVPIHDDLKTFTGKKYANKIGLLTAGYPCQGESEAGKGLGKEDERWLGDEVLRVIRIIRPRWVICENVNGHIKRGADSIISQMETEGYTVWPIVIPACAVDASHRRDRIWIIAHASGERCNNRGDNRQGRSILYDKNGAAEKDKQKWERRLGRIGEANEIITDPNSIRHLYREIKKQPAQPGVESLGDTAASSEAPAHPTGFHAQGLQGGEGPAEWSQSWRGGWGEIEPTIRGMDDGISKELDDAIDNALIGLGNAIVPYIAYLIMLTMERYERF